MDMRCDKYITGGVATESLAGRPVLSAREIRIMKSVAEGKKLTTIAAEMGYADDSCIDLYLREACKKVGIPRATALVTQYALKHGIAEFTV
jgi:DNA-binding NarL/FixJ family response regulator